MNTQTLFKLLACGLFSMGIAACSDDPIFFPSTEDTATDAVDGDATTDASEDVAADAAEDTQPDAAEDTQSDAAADTEPDAVLDAEPDAVEDAEPDAVEDAEPDAVEDADAVSDVPEPDPFVFSDSSPEGYARVDRAGMPAVGTVLIVSKDAYNVANPSDDLALAFATELISSLDSLHQALDDDLAAAGLETCTAFGDGTGTCLAQGAPLIIPDALSINLLGASGFPNGRQLADPVIDVTLAVLLLDLSIHPADTFASLPLNPPANDVPFQSVFPFLAPPH